MPLVDLDHVNIRTANLPAMIAWYGKVLGMHEGPRPPFPFPGAWLYVGDRAAVHLIGVEKQPGMAAELQLEHFAFAAEDMDAFKAHLDSLGETYERAEVPGVGVTQLNLWDPDGNHLHVDFRTG